MNIKIKDDDPFYLFGKPPKRGYKFDYIGIETYQYAIVIKWSARGIGFGELTIYFDTEKVTLDNEGMNKKFCDACIKKAAEHLESKDYLHRLPILRGSFLKALYKQYKWPKK